jgi:hypothetical protein
MSLQMDVMELALPYLDPRELAAVSQVNKEFLAIVRTRDSLWDPVWRSLSSIPLHNYVDTSNWDLPDCPRQEDLKKLLIPSRMHLHMPFIGEYSYLPHPHDHAARDYPVALVLCEDNGFPIEFSRALNLNRINPANGKLEDLFHPASEPTPVSLYETPNRTAVWLPRAFPCRCECCHVDGAGVEFLDQLSLFQHCNTYLYQHNSTLMEEEQVPEHFVDPRHREGFESLYAYTKTKQLREYKSMVLRFLRAPMDADGVANMQATLQWIRELVRRRLELDDDDTDDPFNEGYIEWILERCTLSRLQQVCVEEFAVRDFLTQGMSGYCLRIVFSNGWDDFKLENSETDQNWWGQPTPWEKMFCLVAQL